MMPVDKRPTSGLDLAVMMLLDLLPELKRLQERDAAMREIVEAVANMYVEGDIFDQPFYALMHAEHERDEDWHTRLITKARALLEQQKAGEPS